MCKGNVPVEMDILRRTALNMKWTVQQNFGPNLSIGLLHDQIGHHPWILVPILA